MQIKAPRGTYDILPVDSYKWQVMEKTMRETAELFGYQEIRVPIFEHTELFERGVGETTDIVSKEMYTFTDKGDRSLTLRPEGTASCVRVLIEHKLFGGLMPIKWYYTGPMFRYDRPQAGRYRQFHQFGIEAFGSNSPYLDVEVIMLMLEILNRMGLKNYELHINSVGCPVCREVYRQKLVEYITPVKEKLCEDCQVRYRQNPLRVLDCKVKTCHSAITGCPSIKDNLCPDCQTHYEQVKAALTDNGISYLHDDNLVRGLDYYSNTAFEVHIPGIGAQSAVGGGGRYNGLVKECGGPELPGIGFALGMERLLLALDKLTDLGNKPNDTDVFIVTMNNSYEDQAVKLLYELRQANIKADKDYNGRSSKAQMKYADKLGARLVVLLGEEEISQNYYTLRNMQTRQQVPVPGPDLINHIKNLL
ncbi:MAG: histidine--tRNA ligase [Syntrophomonadaceae bacterium]|jgi:histidyl-tRNA synthetase